MSPDFRECGRAHVDQDCHFDVTGDDVRSVRRVETGRRVRDMSRREQGARTHVELLCPTK